MALLHPKHNQLSQRIILFLSYKGIDHESISFERIKNSMDVLRELEFQFPHPILFIGPVEGEIQWAEGVLPDKSLFENKQQEEILKKLNPYFQEIIDKVEDQFFVMGPTFSVVDCVLAGDLIEFKTFLEIEFPKEITTYTERVKKKCAKSGLFRVRT